MPHPRVTGCVLGLVADGMGGRSGGRKASDQVVLTAKQLFARFHPDRNDASTMLRQLLEDAHMVIKLTAIASEEEPHSTVAAFLLKPNGQCAWIHAGDSRLYHFHEGALIQRTRDHSFVQSLIDLGELTEEEALSHPQGNVLLGCLGTAAKPPPMDTAMCAPLRRGDVLMACSDGVWHYFKPEEFGVVLEAMSPRDAVELLVAEAHKRGMGAGDNMSIAVLKLEALPED